MIMSAILDALASKEILTILGVKTPFSGNSKLRVCHILFHCLYFL